MVAPRQVLRQVGIGANLYAEDWDQFVPRGSAGEVAWYVLFMPFLAQKPVGNDYRTVEIYRCPSYPSREQTVCFVINGWDFKNRSDRTGSETRTPTRTRSAMSSACHSPPPSSRS